MILLLACLPNSGCIFFKKPGNLGSYSLCQATGESESCRQTGDIAEQAKATGYWDLTLNFPGVVDGTGTIVLLSDAFGVRRIGNITQCIPEARTSNIVTLTPIKKTGTWKDYLGFHLRREDFVRLENVQKLGPRFGEVSSLEVRINPEDIFDEALDTAEFVKALQSSYSQFNGICRSILQTREKPYVVTKALVVKRILYIFYRNGSEALELTEKNIGQYFVLDPSVSYDYSPTGGLIRSTSVYVGLKAVEAIDSLGVPSSGDPLSDYLNTFCKQLKSCSTY
jgi:hypothetical protein